jgi:galactonate dehydratase
MRVDSVETVVVGARMRNWVFVKVTTDEGIVGWGEATTEWKTRGVVGAVEDLAVLVVGQDPFRLEHLWQSMWRHQYWPPGVVVASAVSGIDQALHDIKARALGIPLYELLGGAVRDRIRLYDHLGGGDPDDVYAAPDPGRFAEAALESVGQGYSAIKMLPVPVTGPLPTGAMLRHAERVTAAVRNAVGDDVEVMIDLHGRTSPDAAVLVARALAPLRPWFLEEPVQPDQAETLPRIAAAGVPLATGERLVGRAQFRALLDQRAVAVVQPDVCHCGGISEMKRIAALAETYGVAVAPHNPLGPIATAYNLHFAASTPNWLIQEQMRNAVPWWDEVVTEPLVLADGHTMLPVGPGLGIEIDEAAAARHPYEPEDQVAAALLHDGSVADW